MPQIAPLPRPTATLASFFEPKAIAVIGASRARNKIGSEILHNLISTGFTGEVVPIHPVAATVQGKTAYARVSDVPFAVDLVVIAVPAAQVSAAVDDCLAKGVPAICIISAGFGECSEDGRAREQELVCRIRDAGSRLIGPNCMGLLNTDPAFAVNATFSPVYPPAGTVAMSTQSGALGLAILDYAGQLSIGISSFVSIGNKADVSGNDLLQYWERDPRTSVILLYVESFGNPAKFSRIARRISRCKPRVAAYGEWRRQPEGVVPELRDLQVRLARRIVESALQRGGGWLSAIEAASELTRSLGDRMDGLLVQQMVSEGAEMMVGAIDDATFGHVVVCGSGGVLIDLLADSACRLHPVTDRDAADMVAGLKGVRLLRGSRGAAPADEAAFQDAILRISALVGLCPEIQELDVNPLKVLPGGVSAVDVRIRVAAIQRSTRPGAVS